MSLLTIQDLTVEFPTRRRLFTAVDRADLSVEPGEIHGLVGESGAGKSTIGAAVMGLLERPGRIASGQIKLGGEQISGLDAEAMRGLRGKKARITENTGVRARKLNDLERQAMLDAKAAQEAEKVAAAQALAAEKAAEEAAEAEAKAAEEAAAAAEAKAKEAPAEEAPAAEENKDA